MRRDLIIGRLRRPGWYVSVFPVPRDWMQILPVTGNLHPSLVTGLRLHRPVGAYEPVGLRGINAWYSHAHFKMIPIFMMATVIHLTHAHHNTFFAPIGAVQSLSLSASPRTDKYPTGPIPSLPRSGRCNRCPHPHLHAPTNIPQAQIPFSPNGEIQSLSPPATPRADKDPAGPIPS